MKRTKAWFVLLPRCSLLNTQVRVINRSWFGLAPVLQFLLYFLVLSSSVSSLRLPVLFRRLLFACLTMLYTFGSCSFPTCLIVWPDPCLVTFLCHVFKSLVPLRTFILVFCYDLLFSEGLCVYFSHTVFWTFACSLDVGLTCALLDFFASFQGNILV